MFGFRVKPQCIAEHMISDTHMYASCTDITRMGNLKYLTQIQGQNESRRNTGRSDGVASHLMTDDQIAQIGSTTRLKELPAMLNDDDWNNIEPALLEFARKCIELDIGVSDGVASHLN